MTEYIEREAVLRYLNDIWLTATPMDFMPDDDRQLAIVRCMGINDAMDAVKDAPAADVVPVRHGRWTVEDITGLIKCSECENDAPLDTTGGGQWNSPFCPSCGALMDKDGDGK